MERAEMTYGEQAVGLSFNPGGNPEVEEIKQAFAELIDKMHDLKTEAGHSEKGRLASIAITEMQTAQMWAVKAITWRT